MVSGADVIVVNDRGSFHLPKSLVKYPSPKYTKKFGHNLPPKKNNRIQMRSMRLSPETGPRRGPNVDDLDDGGGHLRWGKGGRLWSVMCLVRKCHFCHT